MLQRPSFRRGRSEQSSGNAEDSGGRFRHRQSKRGGSGDGFSPEGSLLFSRDDSLRSRWRQALLFQASQIRKLAELCSYRVARPVVSSVTYLAGKDTHFGRGITIGTSWNFA